MQRSPLPVLDLTGLPMPEVMQGQSLAPLLRALGYIRRVLHVVWNDHSCRCLLVLLNHHSACCASSFHDGLQPPGGLAVGIGLTTLVADLGRDAAHDDDRGPELVRLGRATWPGFPILADETLHGFLLVKSDSHRVGSGRYAVRASSNA